MDENKKVSFRTTAVMTYSPWRYRCPIKMPGYVSWDMDMNPNKNEKN